MAAASFPVSAQTSGWERPSVLVIGDTEASLRRGARAFELAERAVAAVTLDGAEDRLAAGPWRAVWIELEDAYGERADSVLRAVDRSVADGRYKAVVSAVPELIDPVSAAIGCVDVELLINGSDADRAAASAIVGNQVVEGVRDAASDAGTARLRQLSEEVGRIAATLARLSGGNAAPGISEAMIHAAPADAPAVPAELVRNVIKARRLRAKHLPADLFADPAWDMLLDLLQAEIVQHRVPVSSLCSAAAVPATTALRWIKTMTERGILQRRNDPHDGRRVFIELGRGSSTTLRNYFAEAGKLGLI
jgi:DNA-binding MarR family transcriptional regulator